jgi:hypothetical protein
MPIYNSKPIPKLSEKDINRFNSKIDKSGSCWNWIGSYFADGYPQFRMPSGTFRAHRIAYFLKTEEDPTSLVIRHSCDNPSCVNPEHLKKGTVLDNVQDRVKRGRSAVGNNHGSYTHPERFRKGYGRKVKPPYIKKKTARDMTWIKGEGMWSAKLSNWIVSNIIKFHNCGVTGRSMAAAFGVSPSCISNIIRRKTWA